MLCILLALVESQLVVLTWCAHHRRLYQALAHLGNSLHNPADHWSPESASVPSTCSEGNISSSCHQWKTAGHTLHICQVQFVTNWISHHAMVMHTYPSFCTHLSRYRVGRLWLLSRGLFPALISPCSLIPWILCQPDPFYKAHLPVLHSRRPQQLSFDSINGVLGIFLKMHKRHNIIPLTCCKSKGIVEWHTFFSFKLSQWMSVQILLKVICILVAGCMIDFIVDFSGCLETHPCVVPVCSYKCSTWMWNHKALPKNCRSIALTPKHTSFRSRDVRHSTTGWHKQMAEQSLHSICILQVPHIHTDHTYNKRTMHEDTCQ